MTIESRRLWFGGDLVKACDAHIPVVAATAQFGLNVFEGLRAYWNDDDSVLRIFRLDDHLRRLKESCLLLDLELPYTEDEILSAIEAVVAANGYAEDLAVRVTVLVAEEGSWSSVGPTEMFVAPIPRPRKLTPLREGVAACVSSWERIDDRSFPPLAKVGANYMNGRYAHLEAQRTGYDLPILLNRHGTVAEGAGACLFGVRNGRLITPDLASSILDSITRDTIFVLADRLGFEIEARPVLRSELYLCDELFLCGSAAEVTPVTSVDRRTIGSGLAGDITSFLHCEYLDVVDGKSADTPEHWLTAIATI